MAPSVLIADADGDLCELYRRFFSHLGWRVQTSGEGLACLAELRKDSFQLLILDRDVPWGGADGVLAIMREDPKLARVPVVLTVAAASRGVLVGLAAPPVVRAVAKPFSLNALLEVVRSEERNGPF